MTTVLLNDLGDPLIVLAASFGLLIFTVSTGLWLDGRANKKIRKAEQRRARSITDE